MKISFPPTTPTTISSVECPLTASSGSSSCTNGAASAFIYCRRSSTPIHPTRQLCTRYVFKQSECCTHETHMAILSRSGGGYTLAMNSFSLCVALRSHVRPLTHTPLSHTTPLHHTLHCKQEEELLKVSPPNQD